MNVALRAAPSVDEFLAWEEQQELRWEFDGQRAVAMTGGTVAHSVIASNLIRALEDRLHGKPCQAFRVDLKILVAGRVRYPNAVVTCTPVADDATVVPEPVVVFEVLPKSTAKTDRTEKNEEYRLTPSVQHYVMLEQTLQAATIFSRRGENWVERVVAGDAVLAFPEVDVELPLTVLYARVRLLEANPAVTPTP